MIRNEDAGWFGQLALGLDVGEEDAPRQADAALISEAARTALETREEMPDWWEEYCALRNVGWDWRVGCYIAWAASPRQGRWPETLEDLAQEVLGLTSPRAIHTWRQKNPAIDEVIGVMQSAPLFEHRRDIIEALITVAKEPDYKGHADRKLALEMLGDYTPRSKVDVEARRAVDLSELSDEELDRLAGKFIVGETE
jgi:hypothetical protein